VLAALWTAGDAFDKGVLVLLIGESYLKAVVEVVAAAAAVSVTYCTLADDALVLLMGDVAAVKFWPARKLAVWPVFVLMLREEAPAVL
jgi:hypothetical protein